MSDHIDRLTQEARRIDADINRIQRRQNIRLAIIATLIGAAILVATYL